MNFEEKKIVAFFGCLCGILATLGQQQLHNLLHKGKYLHRTKEAAADERRSKDFSEILRFPQRKRERKIWVSNFCQCYAEFGSLCQSSAEVGDVCQSSAKVDNVCQSFAEVENVGQSFAEVENVGQISIFSSKVIKSDRSSFIHQDPMRLFGPKQL